MSRLSVMTTVRHGLSMTFHGFSRFSCFVQVDIRLRVKGGGFTGQIYALRQVRLLGTEILAARRNQGTITYQVSQNPLVDFGGLLDTRKISCHACLHIPAVV